MAALTPTLTYAGEFAGDTRIAQITVVPTTTSDTVTLTAANCGGVTSVVGPVGAVITAGMDANLLTAHPSVSGLVITLVTLGADGLAATDWTGASVTITLLIKTTASS